LSAIYAITSRSTVSVLRTRTFHLDARAKPIDDRHQTINGEPPEICIPNE
jgi:hypothetical protein